MERDYTVKYKEILMHEFTITAETEEEAIEKFNIDARNGMLDFSDGYLEESGIVEVTKC